MTIKSENVSKFGKKPQNFKYVDFERIHFILFSWIEKHILLTIADLGFS